MYRMAAKHHLLPLCFILCSIVFSFEKKFSGTIEPMDPNVCTAQNITFTSVLLESPVANYSIGFAIKNRNTNGKYVAVDPGGVTEVNENTARFTVLNFSVEPEYISKPVYFHVRSYYWKEFGDFDSALQLGETTSARVYPRPEKVQDFKCIVLNYQSLKCTWNYGKDYGDESMPKVIFQWKNPSISEAWNYCKNLSIDNRYCYWKNSRAGYFKNSIITVRITLQQECGLNVSSEFSNINTGVIVKPNPVSSISSEVINSTCIQLFWKATNSEPQNAKEHRIIVSSEGKNLTFMVKTTRKTERFPHERTFCNLRPYTVYTFSVRIKPTGDYSGYFSDPRKTVSRTYPDRPSASPEVTEGGFNWNHMDCERNNQERRVCVFWKSIKKEQQNGPMKGVQGQFNSTNGQSVSRDWAAHSTYGCGTLLCNTSYYFTVMAININGTSDNESTIKIPKYISEIERPEFIVESANASDVYISWSYHGNLIAKGFTVAWCRNQNGDCESDHEINWKHFPWNRREVFIQIKVSAQDFLYGVSVLTDQGSSGIEWQDCVYIKDKNPKREPQNVIVSVGSEDNTLVVTWDKLTCTSDEPYIAMYNVRYRTLNDRKKKSINVTAVGEARVVLMDLEEDQTYAVTVSGITNDGRFGPESQSQTGVPVYKGLIPVEIAGISMAVMVCVTFAAVGFFCVLRRCKKTAQNAIREAGTITLPDAPGPEFYTSFGRKNSEDSGYDMTPPPEEITKMNTKKFSNKLYVRPDDYYCATIGNGESPEIVMPALEPELKWSISDRLNISALQKGNSNILSPVTKGLKLMLPKPLAFFGTSDSALSCNESDFGIRCIDDHVKCKSTSSDLTDHNRNAPPTTEPLSKRFSETSTTFDDSNITHSTYDKNADKSTALSEDSTVSTNNIEDSQNSKLGYVPQNPPLSSDIISKNSLAPQSNSECILLPSNIVIKCTNSCIPHSNAVLDKAACNIATDLDNVNTNVPHSKTITDSVPSYDTQSCIDHDVPNNIVDKESSSISRCAKIPRAVGTNVDHGYIFSSEDNCACEQVENDFLSDTENAEERNTIVETPDNQENSSFLGYMDDKGLNIPQSESVDFENDPDSETETEPRYTSRSKDGYIAYYVLKNENGQVYIPGNPEM